MPQHRISRTRAGVALLAAGLLTAFALTGLASAQSKIVKKPFRTTDKVDHYRISHPERFERAKLIGYPRRHLSDSALRAKTRRGVLKLKHRNRRGKRRLVLIAHTSARRPNTRITSGPAAGSTTTATSATFTFRTDRGTAFSCSRDFSPWRKCTSPRTYSSLQTGKHTFRVRASTTRRTDHTPAERSWTVVAPEPQPISQPVPGSCSPPYSATSPWNTPIPSSPAYDVKSSHYVSTMQPSTAKLTSDPTQYTYPVYYVDSATPLKSITYSGWFSAVRNNGKTLVNTRAADPSKRVIQMPIPEAAVAAAGSDAQVIIINRDTGEEWNASHFYKDASGYHAWNIGRYNVTWSGVPPYDELGNPYWNRGAGVPYLTGLIRPCEIAQGRIDHALAFAYPMTTPEFRYPATRSDGQNPVESGMPEGARLQLDPSVSDSTIQNTWGCKGPCFTIAKALQRYGMYLIDGGGRPKIMPEYEATAHWNGSVTASTPSSIPLSAFKVLAPMK